MIYILFFFSLIQYTTAVFFNLGFILVHNISLVSKNDRIPLIRNGNLELTSRENVNIKIISWSSSIDWTCFSLPFSSNNLYLYFILLINLDLVFCVLLIGRRIHLVLFLQVYPQLKTNRKFFMRGRNLRVNYSSPSSHPLNIPGTNFSFMTLEILVVEAPFEHICNCLKSSMGMIRKSSRQPNFKKVKHQKRIQIFKVLIADDSEDSCSLTLILPGWLEDE